MRLRLQQVELESLLHGGMAENRTVFPDGREWVHRVRTGPCARLGGDSRTCQIDLPEDELRRYHESLPTRTGLNFILTSTSGTALTVTFDVDVRDSVRRHYPSRASKAP